MRACKPTTKHASTRTIACITQLIPASRPLSKAYSSKRSDLRSSCSQVLKWRTWRPSPSAKIAGTDRDYLAYVEPIAESQAAGERAAVSGHAVEPVASAQLLQAVVGVVVLEPRNAGVRRRREPVIHPQQAAIDVEALAHRSLPGAERARRFRL